MSSDAKLSYRLGVDVGGTFTDLLLSNELSGESFAAKVPSTPEDSSVGVLAGIAKICEQNAIDPQYVTHVTHGTTVATNAVLEGKGARVGLVTTKGYRQVLQIARSFVPGGLGGWVIYNKRPLMAPLELTIEADERLDARGEVIRPLDEMKLTQALTKLKSKNIEALTVCLVNSYANPAHELLVRQIAETVMPDVPISISSEVIPEMGEYERTETTVVNSYIRPLVSRYLENLHRELKAGMKGVKLHLLRSDGGLSSMDAATRTPVNLLMSGPAGGVAGAQWVARESGFSNLLTFDMGGTSTDVALISNGIAQTRRETRVTDVTVRAPSIDVRTVGAGGGSVAYVPELTKALRVGPQSAGAMPGPAAYMRGGDKPTVTDANVVLGYLPASLRLGGDMKISSAAAQDAISTIAESLGKTVKEAAEGIINIVNENMFGALRLVSIEQGYDPRGFALAAFGGAGPLHANALARLMGSWPVIIPPAPGVLCAYGDITTRLRDEASRTFVRSFAETSDGEVLGLLDELTSMAAQSLEAEGISRADQSVQFQIDIRYRGQLMSLTLDFTRDDLVQEGIEGMGRRFDEMHTQLYTFATSAPHEVVSLRAVVQGPETKVSATRLQQGNGDPSAAAVEETTVYVDGADHVAMIYDRSKLRAGDRIPGPAIVFQMDTTTLILPGHTGEVDDVANILIRPNA